MTKLLRACLLIVFVAVSGFAGFRSSSLQPHITGKRELIGGVMYCIIPEGTTAYRIKINGKDYLAVREDLVTEVSIK